jgi:hypothetical protein
VPVQIGRLASHTKSRRSVQYSPMACRCVIAIHAWLVVGIGVLGAACSANPTVAVFPPKPVPPTDASTAQGTATDAAVDTRAPALEISQSVTVLAIDTMAPPNWQNEPAPLCGVRWRTAVPGGAEANASSPIVLGGVIVVSGGNDTISAVDGATGKIRRTVRLPHTRLVGDHALVATTEREEFGVDPATLTPTWRAPAPNSLHALGDWCSRSRCGRLSQRFACAA